MGFRAGPRSEDWVYRPLGMVDDDDEEEAKCTMASRGQLLHVNGYTYDIII